MPCVVLHVLVLVLCSCGTPQRSAPSYGPANRSVYSVMDVAGYLKDSRAVLQVADKAGIYLAKETVPSKEGLAEFKTQLTSAFAKPPLLATLDTTADLPPEELLFRRRFQRSHVVNEILFEDVSYLVRFVAIKRDDGYLYGAYSKFAGGVAASRASSDLRAFKETESASYQRAMIKSLDIAMTNTLRRLKDRHPNLTGYVLGREDTNFK